MREQLVKSSAFFCGVAVLLPVTLRISQSLPVVDFLPNKPWKDVGDCLVSLSGDFLAFLNGESAFSCISSRTAQINTTLPFMQNQHRNPTF